MFRKKPVAPFISLNGTELDLDTVPDRSMTLETYKEVRANTPGWKALLPKLNVEALIYATTNCVNNVGRSHPLTYDYALNNHIVPELIARLQAKEE